MPKDGENKGERVAVVSKYGIGRRTILKAVGATGVVSTLSTPTVARKDNDKPFDVIEATVSDIHAAIINEHTTIREVVEQYLERIETYNDELNAILTVNPKALDRADELDGKLKDGNLVGPLHGIPTILKDNQDTKDMPTSGGAVTLEESMAPDDAFVVK